jgi:dethiobiotin synthetase
MTANRVPGLFITGTDTGVGKTHVAAMIARSLLECGRRVGVYKPAASGCRIEDGRLVADDAVALWEAAGRPGSLERVCPQCFRAPLAPHLSARVEGRELDIGLLRRGVRFWQANSDIILVEGAGGLMCPLADDQYVADLARDLGYPLVVVSANRLGVINHTLQTLITAGSFGDGLPVAGVVLNNPDPPSEDASRSSNREELARHCGAPILAEVAWGESRFGDDPDWFGLAAV